MFLLIGGYGGRRPIDFEMVVYVKCFLFDTLLKTCLLMFRLGALKSPCEGYFVLHTMALDLLDRFSQRCRYPSNAISLSSVF